LIHSCTEQVDMHTLHGRAAQAWHALQVRNTVSAAQEIGEWRHRARRDQVEESGDTLFERASGGP